MEANIGGTVNGDSYRGTMYGVSYRWYNVWRHLKRIQCKETHI